MRGLHSSNTAFVYFGMFYQKNNYTDTSLVLRNFSIDVMHAIPHIYRKSDFFEIAIFVHANQRCNVILISKLESNCLIANE